MSIQPIHNDTDHATALARIGVLWGADENTAAADELEILVTLVAEYEARHHPILPPDPIEAIRFRMDQLGLTRKDLEPMVAVARGCRRYWRASGR